MTTINPNDNSKPINDPQAVNDEKSSTGKTPSVDVLVTSQLEAALIEEEEIRKLSEKVNENTNNIAHLNNIAALLQNYKTNASDPNAGNGQTGSSPQVSPNKPTPPKPAAPNPAPPPPKEVVPWKVRDGKNPNVGKDYKVIELDNGYEVVILGNSQWQVRNKADGSYVTFNAGGLVKTHIEGKLKTQFFMHGDTTLVLPDGTKITNEVVNMVGGPLHNHGFNSKLTITRGEKAAVVSNMINNPNPKIVTNLEGKKLDADTNDSHILIADGNLGKWKVPGGGAVFNGYNIGFKIKNEHHVPVPEDNRKNNQPTPQPTPPPKSQPTPPPKSQPTPPPTPKSSNPTSIPIDQILSPEDLQLLKELGIKIYDASGTGHLTKTEIEGIIKQIENQKEGLKSISNLDMVKLQSQTNRMQMHFTLASQSMKTFFNTAKEIIRNI